jgi:peptidoglycan/LPS O-acetylase OafA/YrhL
MDARREKQPRLQELDALRGIGALAVMLFHYTTRFHEEFQKAAHVPLHFIGGNYRVLMFFAISGFAIFFSMERLTRAQDFAVNRFARLFPAYWAAMLLTLAAEYLGGVSALQIPPGAVLLNVTMLQGFFFAPDVDGAYWTLAVELGFYASMLMVWKAGLIRRVELALVPWLLMSCLMAMWSDMPERVVMLLVLRYIPFFAIGMLAYRVWTGQRRWRDQLPYAALALVSVAIYDSWDLLVVAIVLFALFAAMLRGWLRFLCIRPLLWVGGISYSLYLVHEHVGFVIMLTSDRLGLSPWIGFTLAIAVAFALGTLVNRYVERPAATAILAWYKRRQTPRLAPAAA